MFGRRNILKQACLVLMFLFPGTMAPASDKGHSCFQIDENEAPDASISACTEAIASGLEGEALAKAHLARGVAHRELGHLDQSVSDLERSLEIVSDTGTQRMLAWTYREQGRYSEAEDLYTDVLRKDDHWQGWLSRCVVRTDMGAFEAALSDCEEAEKQTTSPDIMFFKGRSLLELNRPRDAFVTVEPGLAMPDINGRLFEIAAIGLWNSGQYQRALETAKRGLEIYPADPDILWFLSQAEGQ